MLQIELQQVGKRFGKQWLFQNVSALLKQGNTYALTGNNGSGKSTLLQIIYGYQTASKGNIVLTDAQTGLIIPVQQIHQQTSYVAPYLDLPEELTLEEQLNFHFNFKTLQSGYTIDDIIKEIWLNESRHKKVKHFSSGMKQRVKLAQAFYANSPILFFDEPCTNLDARGIEWYREMVLKLRKNKLVVIASNQTFEYDFADEVLRIEG
jgi:ABC-type multidrug transport system ATPase subunit